MALNRAGLRPPVVCSLAAAAVLWGCGGGRTPELPPLAEPANPEQIETTVYLIGDAGAPSEEDEPVLVALTEAVRDAKGERLIVFLGDNIYPRGLPDSTAPDREEMERRIRAQIDVATETRVRTYFVPGNHDWDRMGRDGWNAVRRQGEFISRHGAPFASMEPSGGCPGPVFQDVGSRLRLVLIDSQWWLHDFARPTGPESDCPTDTISEVVDSLDKVLDLPEERHALVVGHHPLRSGGTHGGYFGRRSYLIPIIPLARRQGASNQDLSGALYTRFRRALRYVFTKRKPLVYASGHDHDLQVLEGEGVRHLLVSGTGIYGHVSPVTWRGYTRFAAPASGFMRLEFLRDGRVRLAVITVDQDAERTERYSRYLE